MLSEFSNSWRISSPYRSANLSLKGLVCNYVALSQKATCTRCQIQAAHLGNRCWLSMYNVGRPLLKTSYQQRPCAKDSFLPVEPGRMTCVSLVHRETNHYTRTLRYARSFVFHWHFCPFVFFYLSCPNIERGSHIRQQF